MKKFTILFLLFFLCQPCFAGIHETLSDDLIRSTRYSEPTSWIPRCQKETGYPEFQCTAAYYYYTNERGRERLKQVQQTRENLDYLTNELLKNTKR